MLGIPREVTEHTLKIRPGSKPVKQRLHRFNEEKRRAIGEEIVKLLVAGFIKEVYHPEWLANPVLVQKKSGKWRIYVDYTGVGNIPPVPIGQDMGRTNRGGPAHKIKACGARHWSTCTVRLQEDVIY